MINRYSKKGRRSLGKMDYRVKPNLAELSHHIIKCESNNKQFLELIKLLNLSKVKYLKYATLAILKKECLPDLIDLITNEDIFYEESNISIIIDLMSNWYKMEFNRRLGRFSTLQLAQIAAKLRIKELSLNGIEDVKIKFVSKKFLDEKYNSQQLCHGLANGKSVLISIDYLQDCNFLDEVLNIIEHEVTHVIQNILLQKGDTSVYLGYFLMAKDKAIRFALGDQYYDSNYDVFLSESDAFYSSWANVAMKMRALGYDPTFAQEQMNYYFEQLKNTQRKDRERFVSVDNLFDELFLGDTFENCGWILSCFPILKIQYKFLNDKLCKRHRNISEIVAEAEIVREHSEDYINPNDLAKIYDYMILNSEGYSQTDETERKVKVFRN